jgi:hypothetical protein
MKKILNFIVDEPVIVLFIGIAAMLTVIIFGKLTMSADYTKTIVVDDSAKIEQALSNAVNDVHSRNFTVVQVNVKQRFFNGKFIVTCGGIERGNFLSK